METPHQASGGSIRGGCAEALSFVAIWKRLGQQAAEGDVISLGGRQ